MERAPIEHSNTKAGSKLRRFGSRNSGRTTEKDSGKFLTYVSGKSLFVHLQSELDAILRLN